MRNTWKIILDEYAMQIAKDLGKQRHQTSRRLGLKHRNNLKADKATLLEFDIEGARSELAVYTLLGSGLVSWTASKRKFKGEPDLEGWGIEIDVKSCSGRDGKTSLILQVDAEDNWIYPLVWTKNSPQYEFIGWCYGWEGKAAIGADDKSKKDRTAHFIPYNHPVLRDPRELKELLEGAKEEAFKQLREDIATAQA